MKVLIGTEGVDDWGYVFLYSVIDEKTLQSIRDILTTLIQLGIGRDGVDMTEWGEREYHYSLEDLLCFVDSAKDISLEELKVFNKFEVSGYDIYDEISNKLIDILYDDEEVTLEVLMSLKPLYMKICSEGQWKEIEQEFIRWYDR